MGRHFLRHLSWNQVKNELRQAITESAPAGIVGNRKTDSQPGTVNSELLQLFAKLTDRFPRCESEFNVYILIPSG